MYYNVRARANFRVYVKTVTYQKEALFFAFGTHMAIV